METYDQHRVKIIRDKIESLKKEISDWEAKLEEITGKPSRMPSPDELKKRVRTDIKTCNDNLARLEKVERESIS